MHLIGSLTSFSLLALGASASPLIQKRDPTYLHHNDQIQKLYARAEVIGEAHGIHAHFEFTGRLDGKGTFVKVAVLSGLSSTDSTLGGPSFAYHVHTNPIGPDGDCAKALAHLDPLHVTESLICDPAFPEYCQEGDLSGKHGKLNGTSTGDIGNFGYTDDYLRFFPEDLSILGRSIVIHAANKTRIACGNITSQLDGTADWSLHPTYQTSSYIKDYPTVAPTNPPQVITWEGTEFPSDDVLHQLPFALANKALSLRDALNVELSVKSTQRYINGTQQSVDLPTETKSDKDAPFHGYWDNSWV